MPAHPIHPSAPTALRRRRVRGAAVGIALTIVLSANVAPARAASPDVPVLVAPADGSTSIVPAPSLQVRPTDPDGGDVQVRFEGRRAGATVPSAPGEPFTIVAIPDTQNYTYLNRHGTMVQQMEWIVDTRDQLDTAFAVQLGDLVSEVDIPAHWERTSAAFEVLDDAKVPYTVTPGNHDFDNATGAVVPYDTYFPPTRYLGAPWVPETATYGGYLGQSQFGPDPIDRRNFDNYALFTAGGTEFLVLNLEWEAPQYALEWADRVLDAHPDRTVVMVTHSFLGLNGARRTTAQRPGGTPPQTMWSSFVSTHCQIRLVLSGHEHSGDAGEARRTDPNSCGAPVHQILTDYQDRANGGDGWLRYYTFDPAAGTVAATTYSPKLQQYETDADSAFTLPFPLGTQEPAPFTPIADMSAASGAIAETTWTGLDPDTAYEWRVVASDGESNSTSPVWTVRTPPPLVTVEDTFSRTVAAGWGRTDTGQDWTVVGAAANYSVDGSNARTTLPPGAGRAARLGSVRYGTVTLGTDVRVTPAPTGSGTYASILSRLDGTSSYRAKVQFAANGITTLYLTRSVSGVETTLATRRLTGTVPTGQPVRIVFETTGASPTTLRARAWPTSGAEPTTWLTTTDSTAALQAPAAVGAEFYQSSGAGAPATVSLDRFSATPPGGGTPPQNRAPTAVVETPTVAGRTVQVSGTASSDADGTIAGHAWSFGDGASATGPTASHTYAADGTYTVTLVVTDDDGATATATRSVTVAAPKPPTASFTSACAGLACAVDASASVDPDGSIIAYAWSFGDGTNGTGRTATKTYAGAGTYTVGLVVTASDGATATATGTVTVGASATLASDAFGRTVSTGWGAADSGGTWTTAGGSAANYSVAGGVGRLRFTAAGATMNANLNAVASTGTDLSAIVSADKESTGGGTYLHLSGRRIPGVGAYQSKARVLAGGAVSVSIVRVNPSNSGDVVIQGAVTVPGLNLAAGERLGMRVQVTGTSPTTIRTRVWEIGTPEPSTWQRSATDATPAFQTAGGVGFSAYLSGSATSAPYTVSVDDLVATPQ